MLRVADIEVALSKLAADGNSTGLGIEAAPWGRFIQISDPDGNGLILQQSLGRP